MHRFNISKLPGIAVLQWLISRVAVIYAIIFLFCLTCVDLKMLDMRIKTRYLNEAIPDFADMIIFSKDKNAKKYWDWKPYKNYFELIMRYLPDDLISRQLLGYVDYNAGQEQKAIDLFKRSSLINGQPLFWSNYNLGVIYYKKGMWPQAVEYLLKAIASNPKLSVILMQESIIYKQIFNSRYFKYSIIEEINEAQSQAFILLLSSLQHLRQYDKMIVIANSAISNPNLSSKDAFYYYAGLAFFEAGQMDKAYLLFEKCLSLEKNNPEIYYYMASILQNAGQQAQARDLFQLSYALHQKNDPRFPYDKNIDLRFF